MARFVITDRNDVFQAVLDLWAAAGLSFQRLPGQTLHCAAARKRAIDHTNIMVRTSDRWTVGTGTYFRFDGAHGATALGPLTGMRPSDIARMRSELVGHYAIAHREGPVVHVFCDEVCSYELFFATGTQNGGFMVGNFLADFLPLVPQTEPSELEALRTAFHGDRGISGKSAFCGVVAVRGHEYVQIEERGNGWSARLLGDIPRSSSVTPETFDAAVVEYTAATDAIFNALRAFPSVAVNVTGGLDSRLVLAAAHKHGLANHLLYGRGNSRMTNTKRQDLAAARRLAALVGGRLTVMDWRQGRPYTAAERSALQRRYGFKQPYAGTAGVLASFEGTIDPYPSLQLAGYGPGFVNRRPWSWEPRTVAPEEFATRYAADYIDVFQDAVSRQTYLDEFTNDLCDLANANGIAQTQGGFDVAGCVALWALAKSSKEAHNINAFNQFAYYFAPHLTTDLLLRLLSVPPNWRSDDHFQIALIAAHCSRVLSIPVFSGTRPFELDAQRLTMAPLNPRSQWSLARRARSKIADIWDMRSDRSYSFETALRRDLSRHARTALDPERFAKKDLRAVYRFVTARELPQAFADACAHH